MDCVALAMRANRMPPSKDPTAAKYWTARFAHRGWARSETSVGSIRAWIFTRDAAAPAAAPAEVPAAAPLHAVYLFSMAHSMAFQLENVAPLLENATPLVRVAMLDWQQASTLQEAADATAALVAEAQGVAAAAGAHLVVGGASTGAALAAHAVRNAVRNAVRHAAHSAADAPLRALFVLTPLLRADHVWSGLGWFCRADELHTAADLAAVAAAGVAVLAFVSRSDDILAYGVVKGPLSAVPRVRILVSDFCDHARLLTPFAVETVVAAAADPASSIAAALAPRDLPPPRQLQPYALQLLAANAVPIVMALVIVALAVALRAKAPRAKPNPAAPNPRPLEQAR